MKCKIERMFAISILAVIATAGCQSGIRKWRRTVGLERRLLGFGANAKLLPRHPGRPASRRHRRSAIRGPR